MDVWTVMQGQEGGIGKGLSTYPDSDDREQRDAHEECLELEKQGKVRRHIDMEHATSGTRYVMWLPVEEEA
jgi:hypothetical protein